MAESDAAATDPSSTSLKAHVSMWARACQKLRSPLHAIIAILFGLKLIITAANSFTYKGPSYDQVHHATRALVGGLTPGVMYYDGPLYYLPALAFKSMATAEVLDDDPKLAAQLRAPEPKLGKNLSKLEAKKAAARSKAFAKQKAKAEKTLAAKITAKVLHGLRITNVLYIAIFYACWIWIALPLLLPDVRSWFLASTQLLALPGYQKLGGMTHADNLFAATSAMCVATWLVIRKRTLSKPSPDDRGWWLLLPLAAGAIGLTRPFAAVPVAVFSGVACLHIIASRAARPWAALSRLLVAFVLVATLSVSWYAYRWANSGSVTNAYNAQYLKPYIPLRPKLDFVQYFTSFRISDLLHVPNRLFERQKPTADPVLANSFFTLLYSETWGDHWLYFSGAQNQEHKLWQKRVLFVFALPVPLLLLAGLWRSTRDALKHARTAAAASSQRGLGRIFEVLGAVEREAVIATWLVLGAALYLYWQTGPALLPGKNSTIKFTYNATLYPLVIVLASSFVPSRRVFQAVGVYLVALFLAALPIALF